MTTKVTQIANGIAGTILQVQQAVFTNGMIFKGVNTWHDMISASITPLYTTSKILVKVNMYIGFPQEETILRFTRDGIDVPEFLSTDTNIGAAPDNLGSMAVSDGATAWGLGVASGEFLHSPATTLAVQYGIRGRIRSGSNIFLNRSSSASAGDGSAAISTITLMEIAQKNKTRIKM